MSISRGRFVRRDPLIAAGGRVLVGSVDRAAEQRLLVQLTSTRDGLAHLVTDADFARGMSAGLGTYPALCGTTILICSLISAPGSRCRTCRAIRDRQ